MGKLELSVIIPVYNEQARVGKTLKASLDYLRKARIRAEILVVDDGSKDSTIEVVEGFRKGAARKILRVLEHRVNRGKGAAVRTGAGAAKGRVILYMDADNSTPLSEYGKFRSLLLEGQAEVAVGSRAVDRSQILVHQPFYRELMGRFFNLLVQTMAVWGIKDTQCGFKAFSRETARWIFKRQTIERFGFDVELLFLAKNHGSRLKEVQVRWTDAPGTKVRVIRDSSRMFMDLITIRLNQLAGKYK